MRNKDFLRIGIFYDGTFFTYAQNYFWSKKYGWLSFQEFHKLVELYVKTKQLKYCKLDLITKLTWQY